MTSKRTKQLKTLDIIFTIFHILCLIGPFLYFIPAAFAAGTMVSKIVLSLATVTSIILAAISFFISVNHRHGLHRSILWLLILGVTTCFTAIKPFICIMAAVALVDELVFVPIRDNARSKARINKEIDQRSGG